MAPPRKSEQFFRPCKWGEYQGYKKRGPPWIKNHVKLLDNPKYRNLTANARAVLHGLWLLTARTGRPLPLNTCDTGRLLGLDSRATGVALKALLASDFIELCDESVAMVATVCDSSVAQRQSTETETEKQLSAPAASRQTNGYAFAGKVIRLNQPDFDRWVESFGRLDLTAELEALDAYYDSELKPSDRKNWFIRTSSALAKKNRDARKSAEQPKKAGWAI